MIEDTEVHGWRTRPLPRLSSTMRDARVDHTQEVEATPLKAESSAAKLDPVGEIDASELEAPEAEPVPEVPKMKVALPDDILEWVDLYLPNAEDPIRLSVREIRRIDEAVMVEFVDSTFTEYTLYKNFLIQRGLESGSDLTGEFDANPHLAENFELEFNNRKLGQILEILYGLTSREVKTAINEQRQSGRRLGDILIKWGRITKQQLQAAIAVSKSGQDTLFSQFFLKVLPTDIWQRFWQLFGEGATMVLVTLGRHGRPRWDPAGWADLHLLGRDRPERRASRASFSIKMGGSGGASSLGSSWGSLSDMPQSRFSLTRR